MEENFKFEIISPEKVIFSDLVKIAKLPSYEGDMSILKDHISIITFLRPGIVRLEKNNDNIEEFFVEEGVAEFFDNKLILLSTSAINLKNLSKEFLNNLSKEIENKISNEKISDNERYILDHKMEVIKEIRI